MNVAAATLDHHQSVAFAYDLASVEIERAKQLRPGDLEILVIMPVPYDALKVDVVEGNVQLDARLVKVWFFGRALRLSTLCNLNVM